MSISPRRPNGPPLNALRAFEAAARLGGFAMAAEELCVTPGAIAQHVKSLEAWAGAPLFERRSQGVSLTELGAGVVGQFSSAFDAMGGAVRALRSGAKRRTINIAALPCVAQLWLSPRLPSIRNCLAEHKISVTALENPPNLNREMFDVSVFLGAPSGRSEEKQLKRDVIFPVCAPEIALRLSEQTDLLNETWLYDSEWIDDWENWTREIFPDLLRAPDGPVFSLYSIALEEAKNGAGVLIGHETLVESHLKNGDLVAPFAEKVLSGKSLNLEVAGKAPGSSALNTVVEMLSS